MKIINLRSVMCAAAALVLWGGVASAGPVIDVENFSDPDLYSGQSLSWSNNGYTYAPTARVNGQCYDQWCLNDFNSTGQPVTTITEDIPLGDGIFSFLGFYVNVNGKVGTEENFIEMTATYDGGGTEDLILSLASIIASYPEVRAFNVDGSEVLDGSLTWDARGYFLAFDDSFNNVTSMELRSLTNGGTVRVDCVAASHDPYAGELPTDGLPLTDCGGSTYVPEPMSLALFGIGALGLALARRRKQQI